MEGKNNILTRKGLQTLEDELQVLKVERRREVAQKIKEAREQGDLAENAEYDAARDEQRDIEARIAEIEKILKDGEVVDVDEININSINIGCTVTLLNLGTDTEKVIRLVGSSETNSLAGNISIEAPLGQALVGKGIDDEVTVHAPIGDIRYRIMMIEKTDRV